jgi:hypothetical protein
MRRSPVSALAILLVCLSCAGRAQDDGNLVANGDFSQSKDGKPLQWSAVGDKASVAQSLSVLKDDDGRTFAELACTRYEHLNPASHAMLAQEGVVRLERGKFYEFSCRARAKGIASRAVAVAISETRGWTNTGLNAELALEDRWKTYRLTFRATQDVGPANRLQIWFTEPGTLDIADVAIVERGAADVEFTDVVKPLESTNLVPNASFEAGAAGWSSLGTGAGWGNLDRLHGRIETSGGVHGKAFLRIPLGGDDTPVLCFDYYDSVVHRELRPLVASRGWIPVEKGAPYTLSCYMRASIDATPALLGLRGQDPLGWPRDSLQKVKLTTDWKRYAFTVRPSQRYAFVLAGPDLPDDRRVDVDVDAVQLEKGDHATDFAPRADVEAAIEPAEWGGVFAEGQPATLRLTAFNNGEARAVVPVDLSAEDFDDKPVTLPRLSVELPPHAEVERDVALPADWRGFYKVTASFDLGGRTEEETVRVAIVPKRSAKDSVLGINHAFVSDGLIRQAAKAGVSWYRDWSLRWQQLEPVKGEYRWEKSDPQIDRVLRDDASLVALMPPFPSADWSSEAPEGFSDKGYPGERLRQAWAPVKPEELAAFIERCVGRYKTRVHVWEFLNEPIYTDYALPASFAAQYGGRQYAPADYVALIKAASAAMRKADPSCTVIGGLAAGPTRGASEVIEAGILDCLDVYNIHIYPGVGAPEAFGPQMDELLKLMDAHGGRKPVWITEFGYYAVDDPPRKPFFLSGTSELDMPILENEKQCADFTVRFFTVMLSRGVEKVFIHSGASGAVNASALECPLFADPGSPRKLFPALAVFTDILGANPKSAGWRSLGPGMYCFAFETGSKAVLVMWRDESVSSAPIAPPRGKDLVWMDEMGRKLPNAPGELSPSPVYLVGPAGRAGEILSAMSK